MKDLAADVGILIREELKLAREEMADKARAAGAGAGMLSGSAIAACFFLASLTALIAAAIAYVLPLWAALAVVSGLWGAAAAALALAGRRKVQEAAPFVPERTIANFKEDVRLAKGEK